MNQSNVKAVENYLKKSFMENPAYSFGDWTIIYDHSLAVRDLALEIAEAVDCDQELVAIEALLHDIGKIFKADDIYLHQHHEELGYQVAKDFVLTLGLNEGQLRKLEGFLKGDSSSVEAKIVKDADIMAFFDDYKLQEAFKAWTDKMGLSGELQRKADKYDLLKFEASKKLARPLLDEMKKWWDLK